MTLGQEFTGFAHTLQEDYDLLTETKWLLAEINLGATSGTLNPDWNTVDYSAPCSSGAFDTYMRDISFAPDGSYFAIVATGGSTFSQNIDGSRSLCDSVTRWNTSDSGSNVQPAWINYSGNDSYLSVEATGTAIYVGGHERWTNNSQASDSAGPGAVPRPGVMAVDPVNGMPFAWNPGRNPRGSGAWTLYSTPQGLYMGSDTDKIGAGSTYTNRGEIAFFPLAGGEQVNTYTPPALPANVYLAGELPNSQDTNVLYRIDAAGPTIPSIDAGPDWQVDTSDPSPYRDSGSNIATYSQISNLNPDVPSGTPAAIFSSERWGEQHWSFPVTPGIPIEVRLYFANRYTGTSQVGQRVFDVALDGTTVLDHYDIVADTGDQTGTMKAFDITSPASGNVTVSLSHEVENPLINGIEIVRTDQQPPTQSQFDVLQKRSFTGTSAGSASTVDSGSIQWSHVRGAFMAGNELFYGYTDGNLYEAGFDGSSLGTPTLVDPYDDPVWSDVDTGSGQTYRGMKPTLYGAEMQSVTGMVYDDGKLYYSTAGSTQLHYRYFESDDGVVGSDEFTVPGSLDTSNIDGMFLAGSKLYYASGSSGNLHAVDWHDGAPDASSDTVVSGPSTDGIDWRARGMFALPKAVNPPPTASFTSSCTALDCSFDASASTAPGSTIASYTWDFGDGGTATGVSPHHTYSTAGNYTVSLTVTNGDGTSALSTQTVSPHAAAAPIAFVGSANVTGNKASLSVTVPSSVSTGNAMLLFASAANTTPITAPSGWTLVGQTSSSLTSITTAVYRKVATSTDAGSTVSVGFSGTPHETVQLVAYSGTNTGNPVLTSGVTGTSTSGTTITSPTVSVGAGGTWAVTYYSAKSSTVTTWTLPSGVTSRDVDNGSGSGRVNSVVGDSDGTVPAGSVGGLTGTTDASYGGADSFTIILTP